MKLSNFLHRLPPYLLRQGFLLNPEFTSLAIISSLLSYPGDYLEIASFVPGLWPGHHACLVCV